MGLVDSLINNMQRRSYSLLKPALNLLCILRIDKFKVQVNETTFSLQMSLDLLVFITIWRT